MTTRATVDALRDAFLKATEDWAHMVLRGGAGDPLAAQSLVKIAGKRWASAKWEHEDLERATNKVSDTDPAPPLLLAMTDDGERVLVEAVDDHTVRRAAR